MEKKSHKVTEKQCIKAWFYREQGLSFSEIARRLKVHGDTAKSWAAKVDANEQLLKQANCHLRDAKAALAAKQSPGEAPIVPSKMPKKGRGLIAGRVRTWLASNPEGTRTQFQTLTKTKVSSPFFSTLKRESKKQPGNGGTGNGVLRDAKRSIGVVGKLKKVEAENDFLKWWVSGERKGWVDRLLKESQQ